MRRCLLLSMVALLGVSAISAQAPAAAPAANKPSTDSASSPTTAAEPSAQAFSLPELSVKFEDLVNRIRPAVVQIFSTGYVTADDSDSGNAAAVLSKQRSTGSGIIMSADGYIVTNAHVVKGARRIQVRISTSRPNPAGRGMTVEPEPKLLEAKLIGSDRDMDVAVIKIERTGLSHLAFGDSDVARQGELVMAFGNPLGLEGSVSMGIISSTSRELHPDDMLAYIQTDAPINPGNSGGPLIDSAGRVIGINTFILTQSGGSEGLGFAIPSNIVDTIYTQLRKEGHVHRGRIGVSVQTITPTMADGLRLNRDWGVLISDVTPGGPADKAGVKIGDVVMTANHHVMRNARQLEAYIFRSPMSEHLALTVLRGKDELSIDVPVIDTVDDPQRFADMVNPENNLVPKLGVLVIAIDKKLADLLPDLRKQYGLVVAAGSTSDLESGAGLQPGDVIYSLNGVPMATVDALKKKLDEYKPGAAIVMQVERSGHLLYIPIELE
ncbi:MAG TPA: trypsin-like peptidase domain-containing protein [Bryobacteraceae bacterium]|nr:trypsin-like peptidase domain-containing protein [Bryobacteraceae bacterium]